MSLFTAHTGFITCFTFFSFWRLFWFYLQKILNLGIQAYIHLVNTIPLLYPTIMAKTNWLKKLCDPMKWRDYAIKCTRISSWWHRDPGDTGEGTMREIWMDVAVMAVSSNKKWRWTRWSTVASIWQWNSSWLLPFFIHFILGEAVEYISKSYILQRAQPCPLTWTLCSGVQT